MKDLVHKVTILLPGRKSFSQHIGYVLTGIDIICVSFVPGTALMNGEEAHRLIIIIDD